MGENKSLWLGLVSLSDFYMHKKQPDNILKGESMKGEDRQNSPVLHWHIHVRSDT